MGEQGQSAIKLFGNLDQGIKEFKKKYSDKTKNKWEERENFVPVPGKYTLIEMEGEEDEEDDEVYPFNYNEQRFKVHVISLM